MLKKRPVLPRLPTPVVQKKNKMFKFIQFQWITEELDYYGKTEHSQIRMWIMGTG